MITSFMASSQYRTWLRSGGSADILSKRGGTFICSVLTPIGTCSVRARTVQLHIAAVTDKILLVSWQRSKRPSFELKVTLLKFTREAGSYNRILVVLQGGL